MTTHALVDVSDTAARTNTYPADWRSVRLGDAFRFTKKPRELRLDGYAVIPFIPMEHVPIGPPNFSTYQMKAADELTSGTYIEDGDLLVAKITPSFENGKQGIIERLPLPFGYATTEVIPINDIPGVSDKRFLASYLLRSGVRAALAAKMEGSTGRQRLSASTLANLEIMLPPLAEQRAIAHVLRASQDAIAARRREVTLERKRKAALMQRLFTRGTRGEAMKLTEIGEMPQSWHVVELRHFLQEPLKNGVSAPEAPSGEGIRTLTLSAVTKDDFSIGNTKVTTADPMRVRDLWLQSGDLFIERANTQELVGSAAMYYGPDRFAIYPDLLIRVRTRSGELDAGYLLEYLRTGWCRSYFRRNARGTAGNMPKIDHETVRRLPLPLPSYDEQSEIAFLARSSDTHIAAMEREIALHDELFRALLEELMSGRLSALGLVERDDADAAG